MKAIRVHESGGPEVLNYEEYPDPVPGPRQVLIKIQASGVNYMDIGRRKGALASASTRQYQGGGCWHRVCCR